jgi:transposase-like protein
MASRPQTDISIESQAVAVAMLKTMSMDKVAKKYGVSKATVFRWSKRVDSDPDFAQSVALQVKQAETLVTDTADDYRALLPIAMADTIRAIQARVATLPDDADSLRACTEAFQTLANYQKGFEAADAYIAALVDRSGDEGEVVEARLTSGSAYPTYTLEIPSASGV